MMTGDPATVIWPEQSIEPSNLSVNLIASAVRQASGVTVSLSSYWPDLRPLTTEGEVSTVSKAIVFLSAESLGVIVSLP